MVKDGGDLFPLTREQALARWGGSRAPSTLYRILLGGGLAVNARARQYAFQDGGCDGPRLDVIADVDAADLGKYSSAGTEYFVALPEDRRTENLNEELPEQVVGRSWLAGSRHVNPELAAKITHLLASRLSVEAERIEHIEPTNGSPESLVAEKRRLAAFAAVDARLLRGDGRLSFAMQAVQMGQQMPGYYIRAEWDLDGKPAFFMTAWTDASALRLSAVDASRTEWMRRTPEVSNEAQIGDWKKSGRLINGFSSHGYYRFLIFDQGYEGYGLTLYEWAPEELTPLLVSFVPAC